MREASVPAPDSPRDSPDWLLDRRRRSESAPISVAATSYLLGVSTRRVEKVVETLGIAALSKRQVSRRAKELDEVVAAFRNRPLDAGPYAFCWGRRDRDQDPRVHIAATRRPPGSRPAPRMGGRIGVLSAPEFEPPRPIES